MLGFFVIRQGEGEEQLVVLATVEGAGGDVEVELFGRNGGLVVNGDALLVDAAPHVALRADVEQLAGEAVADVHHGRGLEPGVVERLDDVAAGFRFELTLQNVFLAAEVGLSSRFGAVLSLEGLFFTFQELQAHVGRTEVTADADEVGVLGSVAVDDVLLGRIADAGEAQGHTGERRGGVAAYEVDAVALAGQLNAGVEGFGVFNAEALAQGQADEELARGGVHGIEVGKVDHGGLVAQVLERSVDEVEVDALHEHVGADQHLFVGVVHHGTVVAYAVDGGGVLRGDVVGQVSDETEFTQSRYFSSFHVVGNSWDLILGKMRQAVSVVVRMTTSGVTS